MRVMSCNFVAEVMDLAALTGMQVHGRLGIWSSSQDDRVVSVAMRKQLRNFPSSTSTIRMTAINVNRNDRIDNFFLAPLLADY